MVTWSPRNFRGRSCGQCYQKEKKKNKRKEKEKERKFNLIGALKCGLYF